MDDLVLAMDPDGTGTVSFDSFHKGVASFLLGKYVVPGETTPLLWIMISFLGTSFSDDEDKDAPPDTDNTNGYHDDCNSNASGDEVGGSCDLVCFIK